MNLSKRCRYGLRAMIDLSVHSKNEHVSLGQIAQRNGISPQYLEQAFAALRKKGLVRSIKGAQGGYYLAKEPEEITVSDILEALDGDYHIEREDGYLKEEGYEIRTAIQRTLIDRVNLELEKILTGITLADLESAYYACEEEAQNMYYI